MGTEGSIPVNREKRHPPEGIEQGHYQEEQVIVRKEVRKKAKENRGKYPKKDYGRSVSKHYNVSDAVKLTFNQLEREGKFSIPEMEIWELINFDTTYEGPFSNYLPNGEGMATFKKGEVYIGRFVNGEASTHKGYYIFDDGSFYEGQFSQSMFNGSGTLTSSNKMKFSGTWKNGLPVSDGKQTYQDGSSYVGGFHEGKWSGKGQYCWPNGMRYAGNFQDGLFQGSGTLYSAEGQVLYIGNFHAGKKKGQGVLRTTYGTYKGQFVDDEITGPGTFLWNDNKKAYVGNFVNNKMNGEGKIIYSTNQIAMGIWQDNHNRKLTELQYDDSAEEELERIIHEHDIGLNEKRSSFHLRD